MSRKSNHPPAQTALSRYLDESQRPLPSLIFILPLLILHEWGVRHFSAQSGGLVEHRVAAFTLLVRFFHWCGGYNHHLPALAVVVILLVWHIAGGDPWKIRLRYLLGIALESLILAFPLVAVFFLFSPGGATYAPVGEWKLTASLYLGAGIYEELLFRLALFALLSLFLIDIAGFPQVLAVPGVVLTGAVIFALYHALGTTQLPWQAFVFLSLRGVYYGILFLARGFGVTVGTHVAYDMIFLALAVRSAT
jgi:membrane protease YdiL (CAAX protease family)